MKWKHVGNGRFIGIRIMKKWEWRICLFVGQAKDDFKHHGTWEDDGAYKPLNMVRLTNSWMRRVQVHKCE